MELKEALKEVNRGFHGRIDEPRARECKESVREYLLGMGYAPSLLRGAFGIYTDWKRSHLHVNSTALRACVLLYHGMPKPIVHSHIISHTIWRIWDPIEVARQIDRATTFLDGVVGLKDVCKMYVDDYYGGSVELLRGIRGRQYRLAKIPLSRGLRVPYNFEAITTFTISEYYTIRYSWPGGGVLRKTFPSERIWALDGITSSIYPGEEEFGVDCSDLLTIGPGDIDREVFERYRGELRRHGELA